MRMFDRPPLLEEPFAQTLSGKRQLVSCRCRKRRWALQAVAWRPVPSFTAVLFECGEGAVSEPWQPGVLTLGSGQRQKDS